MAKKKEAEADQEKSLPSLTSAPGFGPQSSKPAVFPREFSLTLAGESMGGCSDKDLPAENN